MNLKNKRVLLSQHRLVDFTGSEIITLEMAEYFSSKGAEVVIVTNNLDFPIKKYFDKIDGIKIYTDFFDKDLDTSIRAKPPEIAWVHHQILIPALLSERALKTTRYLFNHMSSYYFQEFPLAHEVEQQLADRVFFNSSETKDAFSEAGLLEDVLKEKKIVLNNPAPHEYSSPRLRNSSLLSRLLVVTNHMPEDLTAAIKILEAKGIYVEIAGVSNSERYRRIKPETIQEFDAVVSIGKTVQYSICGGVPVYCYDKFGGPGYLTEENFKKALAYNFSGRGGFHEKTPEEIAHELINEFHESQKTASILQTKHSHLFDADYVLGSIFGELSAPSIKSLKRRDRVLYSYYFELLDKLFKTEKTVNALEKANSKLTKKNIELSIENERLSAEMLSTTRSRPRSLASNMKKIIFKINRRIRGNDK